MKVWIYFSLLLLAISSVSVSFAKQASKKTKINMDKAADETPQVDEEVLSQQRGFHLKNKDVTAVGRLVSSTFGMVGYGEKNTIAVDFVNKGKDTYTVAHLIGVLVDVANSSNVLRNLSSYPVRIPVKPQSNVTLRYDFNVNIEPPAEATLVLLVDYLKGNGTKVLEGDLPYRAVPFQDAIQIVYTDSAFDLQSIFLYVLGLASLIGTVYLFRQVWFDTGSAQKKKTGASRKSSITSSEPSLASKGEIDHEWIPEHLKTSHGKKKAVKRKQKK